MKKNCYFLITCRILPRRALTPPSDKMAGPKDGGWGWCVVGCSFLVHLVVGGLAYSCGLYYLMFLDQFQANQFQTAWTGSLLMAMTAFGGKR